MPSERDPRVEPRKGDALQVRSGEFAGVPDKRWVEWVRESRVEWTGLLRETTKTYSCSLARWRKWARNAEVLTKGADVAE